MLLDQHAIVPGWVIGSAGAYALRDLLRLEFDQLPLVFTLLAGAIHLPKFLDVFKGLRLTIPLNIVIWDDFNLFLITSDQFMEGIDRLIILRYLSLVVG